MVIKIFLILLSFSAYSQTQVYFYYDGGVKKMIKISEDFVAQSPQSDAITSRSSSQGGAVIRGNKKVEIIRKTSIGGSGTATRNSGTTSNETMPVFEAENGQLLAIPGGIMIQFKNSATEEDINQWLSQRSLAVERIIPLKNNIKYYVVSSPAGLETIEMSQNLSTDSMIQEVKPNFWIDIGRRNREDHPEKPDGSKR